MSPQTSQVNALLQRMMLIAQLMIVLLIAGTAGVRQVTRKSGQRDQAPTPQ
jgi:hypothetical protein